SETLGIANLLQIDGSTVSLLLGGLHVGYPAGIALTHDETKLVISGIDADGADQVSIVDLATKEVTVIDDPQITSGVESAGLHRAHDTDTFSWADSTAGGNG